MLSTFYTVTINGIGGSGDSAGFVDNKSVQQYMTSGFTSNSLNDSINKSRANIRFKNIIENLQSMGNIYIPEVVSNGGINTAPTAITLTLEVERGDEMLITQDELNVGEYLYGTDAIARCVARGLMETRSDYTYSVYDPTMTTANINGVNSGSAVRHGVFVTTLNIGGLVESLPDGENACSISKVL